MHPIKNICIEYARLWVGRPCQPDTNQDWTLIFSQPTQTKAKKKHETPIN